MRLNQAQFHRCLRLGGCAVLALFLLAAASRVVRAEPSQETTAKVGETSGGAPAPTWRALRVHVSCQQWGQSATCGAYLPAILEAFSVLEAAPRASADVVVYVNAVSVGNVDRVHLRFVPRDPGQTPREVTYQLDTRASLDAQRAAVEALFLRGAWPFLERVAPDALEFSLKTPEATAVVSAASLSAWSLSGWVGGWGSWSNAYSNLDTWSGVGVSRVTAESILSFNLSGAYRIASQPPLIIDGEEVSLDTTSASVEVRAMAERHLNERWSAGALVRGGGEDALGRYAFTARTHVGLGYDWYRADDPRGNTMSVSYLMGVQHDRYQMINVLGERESSFPSHGVLLRGSVRGDNLTWELRGRLFGEVDEPRRRFEMEIAPSVELRIGDHLDLSLSFHLTKQAVPGPVIDPESFAEVTRSSYAEPLSLGGSFNLRLHWDRTDTARNNRFSTVSRLGNLSSL